jgi:CheY-like chemotaxis protein
MMRVLFVEDEPDDYAMYIDAVRAEAIRRGGQLEQVRTLEEALRCVKACAYDAIVLDLDIPLSAENQAVHQNSRFNGKHLLDYLRTLERSPVRVVCLTVYILSSRSELGAYPGLIILGKSTRRDVLVKAVFP